MQLDERIIVKGKDVTEAVLQRLENMRLARIRKATEQIKLAAKAGGERRILRTANGSAGGAVGMMVHPESYFYWVQRLGRACWSDKQFVREYLRDNEAARVKQTTERPTVRCGWDGTGKRSSTTYKKN